MRPLDDPLADWPNDDLLFQPAQRAFIERRHPRSAPIFDWPELRALFAAHNPLAARFRRRTRGLGVAAVALGCASLILAAFLDPISARAPEAARLLGVVAALLALASGITGYSGILSGRDKWRWLAHRFWTERMRQLHFQVIINNLPAAVEAMSDPAALERWRGIRADLLDGFVNRAMEPIGEALDRMRADLAEDQPWVEPAWAAQPPIPPQSPELDEIFEILEHQRFGIQKRYAAFKLRPGLHSPRTRSRAVQAIADALTIAALLLSAAAGLLFAFAGDSPALSLVLPVGASLAALVLALRVVDEGLRLSSETERYEWYLAAIESLARRYRAGGVEAKIAALREMERLSYQELRWFTVSFGEARFVM